jgi:CRP-like cAMP-binding protein
MQHPEVLIANFKAYGLSPEAAKALALIAEAPKILKAGAKLIEEGYAAPGLHILVSGLCKTYRTLPNGAAQTLALMAPGDLMACSAYVLDRAPSHVIAVSACSVVLLPRARLEPLLDLYPDIARTLWRMTAREMSILQEWMVGMGRRTAAAQLAHLLCELIERLPARRTDGQHCCDLPLTQMELADVMGLSPVHVNRVLQQLRAEGFIELSHGRLNVLDWNRLTKAADFNAAYLARTPEPVRVGS